MKRGLAIVAIVVGVAIGYVVLVMQREAPQQTGAEGGAIPAPEPAQQGSAGQIAEKAAADAGKAAQAAGETAKALGERAAEAANSAAEQAGRLLEQGAGAAGALAERASEGAGAVAQEAAETARAAVDGAGDTARALLERAAPGAGSLPEGPVTPEQIAGLDTPGEGGIGTLAARVGALVDRADIGLTEKAVIRGLLARAETDPTALERAIARLSKATAR